MPYAIMRFEKRKEGRHRLWSVTMSGKRSSMPAIRTSTGSGPTSTIIWWNRPGAITGKSSPGLRQHSEQNPRCKVRKDSVKFIDTIVTASTGVSGCQAAAGTR